MTSRIKVLFIKFLIMASCLLVLAGCSAEENLGEVDVGKKIKEEDKYLLNEYGWTPLYLINSLEKSLPESFIHEPGEFPAVLYWAYNNELNKDIELDLTPYLGEDVQINLYKIAELLPEFMEPRREYGRAVIVRFQGDIIGAWLDAGRHDAFACSLKGNQRENITGKQWGEWVRCIIDEQNPKEQELARLSPEELINEYYKAIDSGDHERVYALESRCKMRSYLFANMDDKEIYNRSFEDVYPDGLKNTTSAKVLDIVPLENLEELEGDDASEQRELRYRADVDLEVKVPITHDSGPQTRFVVLVEETPETGWRIKGTGTGP